MNAKRNEFIDDSVIIQRPSDIDLLNSYIDTVDNHEIDANIVERLKNFFCSKIRSLARSAPYTATFVLDGWSTQDNTTPGFTLTIERMYKHSRLHWVGVFIRKSERLTLTGYLDFEAHQENQEDYNAED